MYTKIVIPSMNSIRLISTVHNARGKCDVDNLLQILEKVEPEVIFGETSPAGMPMPETGRLKRA